MKYNFKSLYQSNVVFVLNSASFEVPPNAAFTSLYEGSSGSGARFVDDPVIESKFLHLPKLQLRVTLEKNRLRIDDDSKLPPDETRLLKEAMFILQRLFPTTKLVAYGFNFDIFYRFPAIIPDQHIFENFMGKELLKKAKLKDLGVQFSLEREGGKLQEVYFIKFTAPLEVALHYNVHRFAEEVPKVARFEDLHRQGYAAPDAIIEQLRVTA